MVDRLVRFKETFDYKPINRKQTSEGRKYQTPDGNAVASVTTILDKTKPEEKKQALQEWRNRVGHAQAQAITTEAASRGTSMHSHLEHWLAFGEIEKKLEEEIIATGALFEKSEWDPMVHLIRAQRVAVAIAKKRGLNPDQPRGLNRSVILS